MNSYDEKIRLQRLCKPHEYIPEDDYNEYRIFKRKKCEEKERRQII
jgi:rRNA maturation protein Nop10